MLLEIGEVLDVERRERELANQAACGDPAVVGRPGTASQLGVGLDLAPSGGHTSVVGEHDEPGQEASYRLDPAGTPPAYEGPFRQFVILGGGLDLDTWLAMIREVFQASDRATVHLKDQMSGPEGFLSFVQSVLDGLRDYKPRESPRAVLRAQRPTIPASQDKTA